MYICSSVNKNHFHCQEKQRCLWLFHVYNILILLFQVSGKIFSDKLILHIFWVGFKVFGRLKCEITILFILKIYFLYERLFAITHMYHL